jgi:hypothetical protein
MVETGAYQFDGSQQTSLSFPALCPACARHVKSELRMVGRDGARGRRDKRLSLELWPNPVQCVMQCGRGDAGASGRHKRRTEMEAELE